MLKLFQLEECSLDINGLEIDKDCNGDQITLLGVSIPTEISQSKKEQTRCIFMLYLFHGNSLTKIGHIASLQNYL